MLIDARALPHQEQLETDVCIVGAGAAGISVAKEFAGAAFRVILLEGGGLTFEHRSQFLQRGQILGRAQPPPENTRRRQFGGTTATWFGRCRPLDEIDFEHRPWFPNSGWPIGYREMDAYLERALRMCEIGRADFRPRSDMLSPAGLESKPFYFSPPTHFGKKYLEVLQASSNLRIVIHANVAALESDAGGARVSRAVCLTLNKKTITVAARIFVLAAGGLENPRILLNSGSGPSKGIWNSNDLVGRYFMEHIYMVSAAVTALPADFPKEYLRLNYERFQRRLDPTPAIGLPESVLREKHLPNAAAFFVGRPLHKTQDQFFSSSLQGFLRLVEVLSHRRAPSRALGHYIQSTLANLPTIASLGWKSVASRARGLSQQAIFMQMEPVPNPASRITLSNARDSLGLRQVAIEWRLHPQDVDGLRRSTDVLLSGLERCGLKLRRIQHELDAEGWPISMPYSKHHMGTTRMSRDPGQGVVDMDCRVHGVENLYVAGSSIFPTAGMANPTLTIVMLAIRLADHIRRVLGP